MEITVSRLIEDLNHDNVNIRLNSLKNLKAKIDAGLIPRPPAGSDVNNHIHTFYSFSPYSPAKAVWMAFNAGLETAGIMDHDSISGAREFIEAGKIIGMATTIGVECRVSLSGTPLEGRRINNPDQKSIAYVALHGIPHTRIDTVDAFFKPYSRSRNIRNRKMVSKLNEIVAPLGITVDFDSDVVPLSKHSEGGSITERHILYALSLKLVETVGRGKPLLVFLKEKLKLQIPLKIEKYLTDESNPHYLYDLLGLLKSELIGSFYIDADSECPHVKDVISLSQIIGAISAYAYLGDVGDSVTGDKKSQKFEDDYLDLLFDVLKELKFNAVTYMPSRNSAEQLTRVRALCDKHQLFQISGEDINSPRQSFVCQALRNENYKNLYDSTWALVGHELAATEDITQGMFSAETIKKYPSLQQRIKIFKERGLKSVRG